VLSICAEGVRSVGVRDSCTSLQQFTLPLAFRFLSFDSRRRLIGELTKVAALAIPKGGAFVRTFTNAGSCEIKVVNGGTGATQKFCSKGPRYTAEIIACGFETAIEQSPRLLTEKD
jgi:hypothetical protein